ncbi:MAG: lipopolysaccharide assembly protein LapA domain-containing protein [Cyanobacteria bacterium J06623_7]
MVLLVIVGLVMAIGAVLFALQNAAVVTINFGVWQLEQSLAVVLIVTLGIGIIISALLSVPTILRRGWQNSQQKSKLEDLKQQLQAKNQATLQQQQSHQAQEESVQELLRAFSFADEVTGVLNKETTIKLTEYLLQQMQQQRNNPRYSSLVVMLFALEPAKSQRNFADVGSENAVYKAIAKRLRDRVAADSFLGITERKRFISLVLGLRGAEVNEYVTYLQNKITESPLQKTDGTMLPLSMTVGAVVADSSDAINSRSMLKQAEQNLERALGRGRGKVEISEVDLKSMGSLDL